MPDGKIVCYKNGEILILYNNIIINRYVIFNNRKELYLGRIKYVYRLLRLGIRSAVALNNEIMVFSLGNILYELNIITGELSNGFFCGEGIRPLIISRVKGIESFEDGLYFGGYLGNMGKRPVNIYYRKGRDNWIVVHTFSQGEINHVHSIVPDTYRQCLWIFTGDFGESAAIWRVTNNFKTVKRVLSNDQRYRACAIFPIPEGLLYATDAPYADNFIYLMNPDNNEVKEVFHIDGSSIYGCQWKDNFVFSTTVEGDGREMSRMEWLFTRKRGGGIKDNYVHMYCGNLINGFREIYKERKDNMPYYTFQFGVFKFPHGVNKTNSLYFQPVATKNNDLCMMLYQETDDIIYDKPVVDISESNI